jgi:hypothetical protein
MRTTTLFTIAALCLSAAPLQGQRSQEKHREYAVTTDRAYDVTRDALGRHGFEVVRIEEVDGDRIIWYRRGNMGRGKGHGPMEKMVIHQEGHHVMLVDVPDEVFVDVDVKLRM